jgi:hypothetical protein
MAISRKKPTMIEPMIADGAGRHRGGWRGHEYRILGLRKA